MSPLPDYNSTLAYIEDYWPKLTFSHPQDKGIIIGLPNPFIAPSPAEGNYASDQFYWDSYTIILGLVASGKGELAKGMVDNFLYLYRRFGIIPSRNRFYNLGMSQPPFLTSMIREIFNATQDKNWLAQAAEVAESELENYWMEKKAARAEKHLVFQGLSRYCDHYVMHLTAEHESGWDMTSRFDERCLDFLPVDLNCLLYKYETDLSDIYGLLGNGEKRDHYVKQAKQRQATMNKLMWNSRKGFFFDYDYAHNRRGAFYSTAGFHPLWAKLATLAQAEKVRRNLKKFEYAHGLANTQKNGLSKNFNQHDYPNGWPHQQWIVVQGLLNYGFKEDVKRIAEKWLDLNHRLLKKTGHLWEKYNVVTGEIGKADRYPTQKGFGWTNAVFVKLAQLLTQ